MKKIKLMLVSLSVFAVVGGALAFTAKTGTHYCTALAPNGVAPQFCPTEAQLKRPNSSSDLIATAPTTGDASFPCTDVECGAVINSTIE